MRTAVIIRTTKGKKYARRIGQEFQNLRPTNKYLIPTYKYYPTSLRERPWLNASNTIIHARAAYPSAFWLDNLSYLQNNGFRVINKPKILQLTSNKLKCAKKMYNAGLPHPKTWEYSRNNYRGDAGREIERSGVQKVVVKPYTSMEQGANVIVVENVRSTQQCTCPHCGNSHHRPSLNIQSLEEAISRQPTNTTIVQEYIDYTAIYRIVVIGGEAVPISWRDVPTPDRWKVSVCLNHNMEFVPNPDRELLQLAERTQRKIEGEVNFIDIFSTHNGYVLSEINTACSLLIHERKAKEAGNPNWNIARYIAEYLNNEVHRR